MRIKSDKRTEGLLGFDAGSKALKAKVGEKKKKPWWADEPIPEDDDGDDAADEASEEAVGEPT